ncbi:uncharacterized protein LOC128884871 [Hylaeus volcanicus]|uniref:uncharacterized protein LOC128884871 n=1 Tax=Hylaeus volcanicus TaxID=313075 RepID=UPI0023B7D32F|nr:uncharacterized protein LOC128884871 [Hylaeus volcanicus]
MDDIMALKTKHMKITDSQMKKLLQEKIKLMDHVKTKHDEHSSEDETRLKELMSEVSSMRKTLEFEKQTLEYKHLDLSKHLEYKKDLEAEKNKFLQENQSLELQRNKLKVCKQNTKDQDLLDNGRRKYMLYKELTRIRWDYEDLKENVKGYVSNKRDYIHHFSYKNEITKELTDLLWKEIYKSTISKENQDPCNKDCIIENK